MLAEIVAHKKQENKLRFRGVSAEEMRDACRKLPAVRDFRAALLPPGLGLIAEIKPASPSRGVLAADVDPAVLATQYEAGGADAVSVLTDTRYFGGHIGSLALVRVVCNLPILRKDFLLDERQVYQSRLAGADAVLLIAAILDDRMLARLSEAARDAGLHILAEAHDEQEVERLVDLGFDSIAFNNRNLVDFTIDLAVTERLAAKAGGVLKVSASGITGRADAARMARTGVDAVLVGEALMTAGDVAAAIAGIKGAA